MKAWTVLGASLALGGSALGCSSTASSPPEPPPRIGCDGCVVLSGATVFDGAAAGIGHVVFRGERIEAVVLGPAEVIGGEVIDVSGHTVLPGLYDLHVHTPASAGPRGYFPSESLVDPHLAAMLRAGVTSFLDLGSSRRVIFEHRARIDAGRKLGPHMHAAGAMFTRTGGHPCLPGSPPGDACWFVDSVDDVPAAMDEALSEHPSVIKVIIESGVSTPLPQLDFDQVKAIVDRAGDTPVIAHVSEEEDIEMALAAGVRAFAHMPTEPLSQATLDSLVMHQAVIVPTLAVFDGYHRVAEGTLDELGDPALKDDVPEEVILVLGDPASVGRYRTNSFRSMAARWVEVGLANTKAAFDAGVRIAAGTDAGNAGTFHGLATARELELYVAAGLPPLAALRAATSEAAALLGDADGGRLAPGARADIVVVEGDATADVSALREVRRVFLAGMEIDRAALALPAHPDLEAMAPDERALGETCLGSGECASGLYCGWQDQCATVCTSNAACPTGSACLPQDTGLEGFCYVGDGCDPLAQDCVNGTACLWLGNAATLCWIASSAVAGEPCIEGSCAPGFTCSYTDNRCVALCDPAGANTCPLGESCIDRSDDAGLPLGECG
jgi:imidazolonepropionase-like amidohydrolase